MYGLKIRINFSLAPPNSYRLITVLITKGVHSSPKGSVHGQLIDNHRPGVPFHGFLCIYLCRYF